MVDRSLKLLTALLVAGALTASCTSTEKTHTAAKEEKSAKSEEVAKAKEESTKDYKEEERIIKAVLEPLKMRGVEIKEVKPTSEVKIPGFEAFEVVLFDKRNSREIKRYAFISPDRKYMVLDVFKVEGEGDKLRLQPIRPKDAVKQVKTDVSWVYEVDKKLTQEGIPHVIGKSDKKIYIVWDVFCPFCYAHFHQLEEIAKKNGVEIHMIPFPIHGENSMRGLLYFTKLAKEKGVSQAFAELYKLGDGNFRKYAEELKKKASSLKLSKEEEDKLRKFYASLKEELVKKGVHATPTIVYIPPGEKDKGYMITGFKPIEEILKMK
jgi:thiol:disulfide interchange protein DsbC